VQARRQRIERKSQAQRLMREVRAHMRSRWRGPVDETVRRAEALFDEIDITGDGIITQQEYYKALELAVPRAFTPEEREVLWWVIDEDGSGEIDLGEFVLFFTGAQAGKRRKSPTGGAPA
jgi:Ca2+-binding EF-hand superfamily protein